MPRKPATGKSAPTSPAEAFAPITEQTLRDYAGNGSFGRGRDYYRDGHIHDTVLRGARISGLCDGSDYDPYQVTVTLMPADTNPMPFRDATCDCPVEGFCKHLVALLLTWIHEPEAFGDRRPLGEQVTAKSHEELVALVVTMVTAHPDLESLLEMPMPGVAGGAGQAVDPKLIRKQVRAAGRGVEPWEWDSMRGFERAVRRIIDLGTTYSESGQWAEAEAVCTAVAEELCEWLGNNRDESGDVMGLVVECDQCLAACLEAQDTLPDAARLDPTGRLRLIRAMYDIWQFDIFETGGDDLAQFGPEAIARLATEDERTVIDGWLAAEVTDDWSKDAVTGFRVMLREAAAGSDEELLEIFRQYEQWDDVAGMLIEMDRIDEAVAVIERHVKIPYTVTALATALVAKGGDHADRAIRLVDDLLWETEGKQPMLDVIYEQWLIAKFATHDRPREALKMARRRFQRLPGAATWKEVREVATLPGQEPDTWPAIRAEMTNHLRSKKEWSVLVDIALDEGDIATAFDAYDRVGRQQQTWPYGASCAVMSETPEVRLARASAREFPDRAIGLYRDGAERAIANRQRAAYTVAAGHLAQVKAILTEHGREAEWPPIIDEVRTTHKSLRALREELDAFDLR